MKMYSTSHLGRKLRRQLTKIVQRETNSTIYLDVCAIVDTNYILCSVRPKQNKNKQNLSTPPPQKKAARRNARSFTEHTDRNRVLSVAFLSLNARPMWLPPVYFFWCMYLLTRGALRNGQASQPCSYFQTTSSPSVSSSRKSPFPPQRKCC